MKDAVATMGDVLPDDAGGRDAVHVAVFSATSPDRVLSGQHVSILQKGDPDSIVVRNDIDGVGLVDPFIEETKVILPGERFWVYLYPRTITALSHKWSHPAFEAAETTYATPAQKIESEEWLKDFINTQIAEEEKLADSEIWLEDFVKHADCPGYDIVMKKVAEVADGNAGGWDEDYLHFNGWDAGGEIPDEFWKHAEIVLGKPIKGPKAKYFSCSC